MNRRTMESLDTFWKVGAFWVREKGELVPLQKNTSEAKVALSKKPCAAKESARKKRLTWELLQATA